MKIKNILVIEDQKTELDSIIADFKKESLSTSIGKINCKVIGTKTYKQSLKWYSKMHFDLIVLDLRLSDGDGINILEHIRSSDLSTPVVIHSGQANIEDMHNIGRFPNNYFYSKSHDTTSSKVTRRDQFINCLVNGEKNFLKIHPKFFIPPVLSSVLFECELYNGIILKKNRKELLKFYRNPEKAFRGKGIVELIKKLGDYLHHSIRELGNVLFKDNPGIDWKFIFNRLTGEYSLEKFEEFLSMDSSYREHFLHQFQDFLIGCIFYNYNKEIIDHHILNFLSSKLKRDFEHNDIAQKYFELGWFLTSMFHDFAFPIQYQDELTRRYFKDNYCYRFTPINLDFEGLILREGLRRDFSSIVKDFMGNDDRSEEFMLLLQHEFKNKNHAIHSAIALRKLVRYYESGSQFSDIFSPVFSGIAIHDWKIWSKSDVIREFFERNKKKLKFKDTFRYGLRFFATINRNIFLHILLIADNMQRWGRTIGKLPFNKSDHIELENIAIDTDDSNKIIWELGIRQGSYKYLRKETFCEYCKTFKTLSVIMGSPSLKTDIILHHGYEYKNTVVFKLGNDNVINCENTEGCAKR